MYTFCWIELVSTHIYIYIYILELDDIIFAFGFFPSDRQDGIACTPAASRVHAGGKIPPIRGTERINKSPLRLIPDSTKAILKVYLCVCVSYQITTYLYYMYFSIISSYHWPQVVPQRCTSPEKADELPALLADPVHHQQWLT